MKFTKLRRRYHLEISDSVLKTWKLSKGTPARIVHISEGRWDTLCRAGRVFPTVELSKTAGDRLGLTMCNSCRAVLKKRGHLPK